MHPPSTGGAERRILVIDDNPSIHEDFRKIFRPAGPDRLASAEAALFGDPAPAPAHGEPEFQVESALQGADGLALVRRAREAGQPYAVAFIDVRMPPGWDGIETTARILEHDPEIQIVICTAYSDYSWNEIRDKLGLKDRLAILKKPFDNIEVQQLATALAEKWRLARRTGQEMRQLERLVEERTTQLVANLRILRTAQDITPDGMLVMDGAGRIVSHNRQFADLWGLERPALETATAAEVRAQLLARTASGDPMPLEGAGTSVSRIVLRDGRVLELRSAPMSGADGQPLGRIWFHRDATSARGAWRVA